MCIILFSKQIFNQSFICLSHNIDFSIDQSIHGLNIFLYALVAAIDRGDSMKLVLYPAKDTVGTEKFLLGLTIERDGGVVL